jgi:hypothetical protein
MRSGLVFVQALVLLGAGRAWPSDKDKLPLFNTFFFEGNQVTYVLTLRQDRSYELQGPGGQRLSGQYTASDKEIGLRAGDVLRHLSYRFDGSNVVFTPTKKDRPRPGHVLGDMPPLKEKTSATFVSIQNWQSRGLPAAPVEGAAPPPPVAAPGVTGPSLPPPPLPAVRPERAAGTYTWEDRQGRKAELRLREGGTFDYTAPDGRKAGGTYLYLNGELTLDSGFWRRHLVLADVPEGLSAGRRETDVTKLDDPLGEMLPQEQTACLWRRQVAATPALPTPAIPPLEPLPPAKDLKTEPAVSITLPAKSGEMPVVTVTPPAVGVEQPAQVEPPAKVQPPAPPPAAGQATSLREWAGTYQHRPNALVTEIWVLMEDGSFEYRDSNGAKASGKAQRTGELLRLQSGEVIRSFTIRATPEGSLVLTRAADDEPRILNDLASMSPSVLKSAQYDKQAGR